MLEALLGPMLAQAGIDPTTLKDVYNRLLTALDTIEEIDARTSRIEEKLGITQPVIDNEHLEP